jgi:hypothetical protein
VACEDDDHTIYVFNLKHQRLVASASSAPTKVLCFGKPATAAADAAEDEPSEDGKIAQPTWTSRTLLSGGAGSFTVWTVQRDFMIRQRGTFAGQTRSASVMCAIALPPTDDASPRFMIGLDSGVACLVEGRQVVQAQKLHKGPLCSMQLVVPETTSGQVQR